MPSIERFQAIVDKLEWLMEHEPVDRDPSEVLLYPDERRKVYPSSDHE